LGKGRRKGEGRGVKERDEGKGKRGQDGGKRRGRMIPDKLINNS